MGIEKVVLANPRGFCAGVDRAIEIVERALDVFGKPLYVKHEIVHNQHVCDGLRAKGAVFVEEVSEIPEGATCIYSAHGVSPQVREDAKKRGLKTIDATCPLVTKIHIEVERFAKEGREIIYIGHQGHPEAMGVMGIRPDITHLVDKIEDVEKLSVKDPDKLVYLTQTTLSVDDCRARIEALKKRFPNIAEPPGSDICYATTNRQAAIKELAKVSDVIVVVGSKNSSNSNRLRETAEREGIPAYLVDKADELDDAWFAGKKTLGISSGASAPEVLVQGIVEKFKTQGTRVEKLDVIEENMKFVLPKELVNVAQKGA